MLQVPRRYSDQSRIGEFTASPDVQQTQFVTAFKQPFDAIVIYRPWRSCLVLFEAS